MKKTCTYIVHLLSGKTVEVEVALGNASRMEDAAARLGEDQGGELVDFVSFKR